MKDDPPPADPALAPKPSPENVDWSRCQLALRYPVDPYPTRLHRNLHWPKKRRT